jgi:uncharacterized protein
MNFKLSKYIVITDVLDPNSEKQERILFSTRTGVSALIADDIYQKLKTADFDAIGNNLLSRLMDYEVIVKEDEDEFQEMLKMNKLGVQDSRSIAMTIQPSANCQLGCFYCGQVHSKKTMTEDIQEKVVERFQHLLQSKNEVESVSTTWYGGEPLMGYSAIINISNRLQAIARERKIPYSSYIITNGLSLKKDIFTELYLNHRVTRFQITVDTTKENHDKRRITKKGEGTFDIIMKNITEICALEHYQRYTSRPIFLRLNIDQTNHDSVTTFIDQLVELGLRDKVEVGLSPITNWGDKTAGDEQGFTTYEFAEMEIEWLMYLQEKGFAMEYILPTRHYDVCMAVNETSEVYDALGNITPCYEFPYTPRYEGEQYTIGNLMDDPSTYNTKTQIRGWYDDLATCNVSPKCSKCNLFPVCNGGCPKNWYNGEITCPTMKINIEDKLVLQYLMDKSNINTLMETV